MKEEKSEFAERGLVEAGDKVPQTLKGRTPGEVHQMQSDFDRLEEYVDEAIAEQRITYRGKRHTVDDVRLMVKMLVTNRSNDEICKAVNAVRKKRGQVALTKPEMAVWRFRGRYKTVILNVRKFIFESMPDIFKYTNPIYVVAEINQTLNYLYYLGIETGLKQGLVDRHTQGLVKLWFQGMRQLDQIVSINIEQIETEKEREEGIDVVTFLKKIRKQFGSNATEQEMIDHFFKERYGKQLHATAANDVKEKDQDTPQDDVDGTEGKIAADNSG